MKQQKAKLPAIPKDWEKDITQLPLIIVTWHDATTRHGWLDWEDIKKHNPIECKTIGFLLPSTKEVVKLAPTIADHGMFGDVWLIPRKWIRNIRKVK